jgi:hypothetical protein
MEESMDDGMDVRDALGGLATAPDEPSLGFGPVGLIERGQRVRRRRGAYAAGGASLAVAAVVGLALVVVAPGRSGPGAATGLQAAGSGHPSTRASDQPTKPAPPQGTNTCVGPSDAQWNTHLAYDRAVRAVLPQLPGQLRDDFDRSLACGLDSYQVADWTVVVGPAAGQLGVNRGNLAGGYAEWTHENPCLTARAGDCVLTRHGDALVEVMRRREGGNARDIEVTAVWPDDSYVAAAALASAAATGRPALAAPPLTSSQLVTLALNPAAHGH